MPIRPTRAQSLCISAVDTRGLVKRSFLVGNFHSSASKKLSSRTRHVHPEPPEAMVFGPRLKLLTRRSRKPNDWFVFCPDSDASLPAGSSNPLREDMQHE